MDKYASQRFNSQSVQTFPPPPSPSSLQAWQLAVPVPLAVSHQASTKSAKVPPASYPTSETWEIFVHLDEVREGGGARRRKNLSSTWTPWQASTTAVITNCQWQTRKTNPLHYQAEEPWQEGADWLCGETGAYALFWVLLRTYKPSQRELLSLIQNVTSIDNCPAGKSLCTTLNFSGGTFWGGGYYKLRDMILFYLKQYTPNFCFDIFSRSVSVIGVNNGYLEVFMVFHLKHRVHFLSSIRGWSYFTLTRYHDCFVLLSSLQECQE